jgi:hypothetical protein
MQPDQPRPSRQATDHEQHDKPSKERSPGEIPADNLASAGVREGATQDSDVGGTEPAVRHPNRPERDKLGGNYNGPDKGRR